MVLIKVVGRTRPEPKTFSMTQAWRTDNLQIKQLVNYGLNKILNNHTVILVFHKVYNYLLPIVFNYVFDSGMLCKLKKNVYCIENAKSF